MLGHVISCSIMQSQVGCNCNGRWRKRTPMVDFLNFSSEIQAIKERMMKKLRVKRRGFFVFQHRSGDFAHNGFSHSRTLVSRSHGTDGVNQTITLVHLFPGHGVRWCAEAKLHPSYFCGGNFTKFCEIVSWYLRATPGVIDQKAFSKSAM